MVTNYFQSGIETSLSNMNSVQQEISTGKQLNQPSDNPAGTQQAMAIGDALAANGQYQTDVTSAQAFLNGSVGAYSTVSTILTTAEQLASQGANSANSASSYTALVAQVQTLVTQTVQAANSSVAGQYVFSGTDTTTAPYNQNFVGPTPTYQGNVGTISANIGPNTSITVNTPGSAIFDPIFTSLTQLQTDLTNAGNGVAGSITALSSDITTRQTNPATVTTAGAKAGSQLDLLQTTAQQLGTQSTQYQQSLSNIEDVDLATAYVQLQSDQNVYQASLDATAKAFQYSLVNYLQ
jgi:flagellar hook-associated protein 3 FlgL